MIELIGRDFQIYAESKYLLYNMNNLSIHRNICSDSNPSHVYKQHIPQGYVLVLLTCNIIVHSELPRPKTLTMK
jgi:hypothetical protein